MNAQPITAISIRVGRPLRRAISPGRRRDVPGLLHILEVAHQRALSPLPVNSAEVGFFIETQNATHSTKVVTSTTSSNARPIVRCRPVASACDGHDCLCGWPSGNMPSPGRLRAMVADTRQGLTAGPIRAPDLSQPR